jgi:hypothetical protein
VGVLFTAQAAEVLADTFLVLQQRRVVEVLEFIRLEAVELAEQPETHQPQAQQAQPVLF